MAWSAFHQRLVAQCPRLQDIAGAGTTAVLTRPVEVEACFASLDDAGEERDESLSGFELLLANGRYELVLSLEWQRAEEAVVVDLGLLHSDDGERFVVHQENDDAGTSLILARLQETDLATLFGIFLADYLGSAGAAYQVRIPAQPPSGVWIAQPEESILAASARGALELFGLQGQAIETLPERHARDQALAREPGILSFSQPWGEQHAA